MLTLEKEQKKKSEAAAKACDTRCNDRSTGPNTLVVILRVGVVGQVVVARVVVREDICKFKNGAYS